MEEWTQPRHRPRLLGKKVYLTCEEFCYTLDENGFVEVDELKSTQEEADTRMPLHALHAVTAGYNSVLIVSEDTDVLVLCVAFSSQISCPYVTQKHF